VLDTSGSILDKSVGGALMSAVSLISRDADLERVLLRECEDLVREGLLRDGLLVDFDRPLPDRLKRDDSCFPPSRETRLLDLPLDRLRDLRLRGLSTSYRLRDLSRSSERSQNLGRWE